MQTRKKNGSTTNTLCGKKLEIYLVLIQLFINVYTVNNQTTLNTSQYMKYQKIFCLQSPTPEMFWKLGLEIERSQDIV